MHVISGVHFSDGQFTGLHCRLKKKIKERIKLLDSTQKDTNFIFPTLLYLVHDPLVNDLSSITMYCI